MKRIICWNNKIKIYDWTWTKPLIIQVLYFSIIGNQIKYMRHKEEWQIIYDIPSDYALYKRTFLVKKPFN